MMGDRTAERLVRPFWENHVTELKEQGRPVGHYEDARDVWVIRESGGTIPLVHSEDKKKRRTRTVTKVRGETTDTD